MTTGDSADAAVGGARQRFLRVSNGSQFLHRCTFTKFGESACLFCSVGSTFNAFTLYDCLHMVSLPKRLLAYKVLWCFQQEFSEVCEYRKNIKIEDLPCLHSADLQTGGRMWRHKARRLSGPDSSHAALCSLQPPLWTPALHCGKVWADLDTAESCSTLQHCRTCLLVFSLPAIHPQVMCKEKQILLFDAIFLILREYVMYVKCVVSFYSKGFSDYL